MSNLAKYSEDLSVLIKNIILKYCPYKENRLYLLGNANSPEIDINIKIYETETLIMFLVGNHNHKQSIPQQIIIPGIVEFKEVSEIIDLILLDHEVIRNLNLYKDSIDIKFAINWTDKSFSGIDCGDISLNFEFNNIELKKQYLYLLFQRYYFILEHVPSFKTKKEEYIHIVKQAYFNSLDKSQLLSLLNTMNENELKDILMNLDNETFIKYIAQNKSQIKVKKMIP